MGRRKDRNRKIYELKKPLGNPENDGTAIVESPTKILNCRLAMIKSDHLSLGEMGDWPTYPGCRIQNVVNDVNGWLPNMLHSLSQQIM